MFDINHLINKYREQWRYLIIGIWNTLFGYLLYTFFYYCFHKIIHYVLLLIINYFFNILNNYICYKFLVFKTRGNYVREYCRFLMVYGASILINLVLLPLFVEIFKVHPLVAQAIVGTFIVFITYFGHKKFSFCTLK